MSQPIQNLFFIERDIEVEFQRILLAGGATPNIFVSREKRDMETPWIEVTFLSGQVLRRKQKQASPSLNLYYDVAWTNSQLELKVCTQRQNNGDQHKLIVGRMRSLVSFPSLCGFPNPAFAWTQPIHVITDIREAGTTTAHDDESDLDYTSVTFSILNNIADSAW